MWFSAWISRVTGQDQRDDVYAGEDWKQDSFRQFMNTLRARYLFARSQLSKEDLQKREDVIKEIDRVFRSWDDSEARARYDDSPDLSEEAELPREVEAAPEEVSDAR
jgi:hypothetical protein